MRKKRQPGFNEGYISFTADEVRAAASSDNPNAEAYIWLDKAMSSTSKVQKKSRKGKMVDIDDIYPVTADETEQMRICLDQAEQCAGDLTDPTFKSRLAELRSIVDWSSSRHSTFQWILIAGVIVTLFFISLMSDDSKKQVANAESQKAKIEAWVEQDTTIVLDDMAKKSSYIAPDYTDANSYKYYKIANIKRHYGNSVESEAENRIYADTASTDDAKKRYKQYIEDAQKSQKEYLEEYAQINGMKFKDVKKLATEEAKASLKRSNRQAGRIFRWSLFFMVLIPLYLFAERPYGYTITRLRLESKILGGIQKLMFALAAGAFTGAAAMEYAPDIITKWSDGSRTRESDTASNMSILVIKLMFYAFAIALFCGTSCFMMTYLTAQGLRRNYNWKPIVAKIKGAATASAAAKVSEEVAREREQNTPEE